MLTVLAGLCLISLTCSSLTLYTPTTNISAANFASKLSLSGKSVSHLDCAQWCLYWQEKSGLCNSYYYQNTTQSCQLASLTFLEDPAPGETALAIMVDNEELERLEMKCRGGEHCCVRNSVRMCQSGEGDCQADIDCGEGLICGENNCNNQGGLWDPEDDCCEPRCLASHPCQEGEGACTDDSGCVDNHFFKCGSSNCHNPDLMSVETYHHNLLSLSSSSRCCARRCHSSYQCGHGQVGCVQDSDCQHGLYCDTTGGDLQGFCKYICYSDERCAEGSGPCRGDNNACQDPHMYICGHDTCRNTNIFPSNLYPDNQKYLHHDDCCIRKCHWAYSTCSYGQTGCLEDRDCGTGLFCNKKNGATLDKAFCDKTLCNFMTSQESSITFYYYEGTCYGLKTIKKNWNEAKAYCATLGGHLTKMDSEEKKDFLNSKMGHHTFWLGATDSASEGTWLWYDGSPVSWTYWNSGQPEQYTSSWDCMAWVGSWRRWRDLGCNYDRYSVCSVKDCHGEIGQESCCTPSSPCGVGGGDCDSNADCAGDLECGSNNCGETVPGVPSTTDCCFKPNHCKGGTDHGSCCTSSDPCPYKGGDCDSDSDCEAGLTCGRDNCGDFWDGATSYADCCI